MRIYLGGEKLGNTRFVGTVSVGGRHQAVLWEGGGYSLPLSMEVSNAVRYLRNTSGVNFV